MNRWKVLTLGVVIAAAFQIPGVASAAPDGRFHGNSCAFRTVFWSENQATSMLEDQAWQILQVNYGQYPVPSGGSVPGVTQSQFDHVSGQLRQLDNVLYNNNPSLTEATVQQAQRFGIKNPTHGKLGIYKAAVLLVVGGQAYLHSAIQKEQDQPNEGYADYGNARKATSTAWQVLKQVPCH